MTSSELLYNYITSCYTYKGLLLWLSLSLWSLVGCKLYWKITWQRYSTWDIRNVHSGLFNLWPAVTSMLRTLSGFSGGYQLFMQHCSTHGAADIPMIIYFNNTLLWVLTVISSLDFYWMAVGGVHGTCQALWNIYFMTVHAVNQYSTLGSV